MKQNKRSIRRTIESQQLTNACAKLKEDEQLMNLICMSFSKAYILFTMSHAFFELAQDTLLDNDAYNTHLLGKSNAVKKTMQEYFDAYEKHLKITQDGLADIYNTVYLQTNKILEDAIHNGGTSATN